MNSITRRDFLKSSAAVGAAGMTAAILGGYVADAEGAPAKVG